MRVWNIDRDRGWIPSDPGRENDSHSAPLRPRPRQQQLGTLEPMTRSHFPLMVKSWEKISARITLQRFWSKDHSLGLLVFCWQNLESFCKSKHQMRKRPPTPGLLADLGCVFLIDDGWCKGPNSLWGCHSRASSRSGRYKKLGWASQERASQ